MTHHAMNQMGHDVPNWLGADVRGVDGRIRKLAPGYMTMGTTGMADMMQMDLPDNAISMRGGKGQYGAIDMGGMFTMVKVRDGLGAPTSRAITSATSRAPSATNGRCSVAAVSVAAW
jgi:hypothetical protein